MTSVANYQLQNDKSFENKYVRHHSSDFLKSIAASFWPKAAKVGNTVGDTTYI